MPDSKRTSLGATLTELLISVPKYKGFSASSAHVVTQSVPQQKPRRLSRLIVLAALTLPAMGAPISSFGSVAHAADCAQSMFFYTGGEQCFVVPPNVSTIHVVAIGGAGGASMSAGGRGAQVTTDLPVTPGSILYIDVGGNGDATLKPGWNGGGTGGPTGGGATDIRTCSRAACSVLTAGANDPRAVVAGGGGGAGQDGVETGYGNVWLFPGGAGGSAANQDGSGASGLANVDPSRIGFWHDSGSGGSGATQTTSGSGGNGGMGTGCMNFCQGAAGTTGSAGSGGNGAVISGSTGHTGGGGGGGWLGGGAGGSGSYFQSSDGSFITHYPGGGGGAGSSHVVPSATNTSFTSDVTGVPQVIITPVLPTDSTPPLIVPKVTGTEGTNGWYTSDVVVSWSLSDPESSITSQSGCDSTSITNDTAGVVLTCTATSAGGTASRSITIKRDVSRPIVGGTPDRPADHSGWYNHPVTVSWSADVNDISGISACDGPTSYVGPDTLSASVDGHCTDGAGNVGSSRFAFMYDATKPNIAAILSPGNPARTGWYNLSTGAPTVSFPCSDAVSGIDGSCPSAHVFGEGVNQNFSATVSDIAGNTNTASVSDINVDLTPPTCRVTMTPGNIWPPNHKMVPVRATVSVSDSGSGAAGFVLSNISSSEGNVHTDVQGFTIGQASTSGTMRAERLGGGSGRVYTLTYSASDRAGNMSSCSGTVRVAHDKRP
ncbi:MAG: hypothetical protein NVSMB52_10350 [Chloroflexota bacterium]